MVEAIDEWLFRQRIFLFGSIYGCTMVLMAYCSMVNIYFGYCIGIGQIMNMNDENLSSHTQVYGDFV